jgi:hypothetical protein
LDKEGEEGVLNLLEGQDMKNILKYRIDGST